MMMDDDGIRAALIAANLSPATLRTYLAALKRTSDALRGKPLAAVLRAPRTSVAALRAALHDKSEQTLATTVGALGAVLKHVPGVIPCDERLRAVRAAWGELYSSLRDGTIERMKAGVPTPQQRATHVPWAAIVAKNAALRAAARAERDPRRKPGLLMDALLSAFFVDLEPRRQSDYHRLHVCRTRAELAAADADPDAAYVWIGDDGPAPYLVVRQFKTAWKHGAWRTELPAELAADLRESLRVQPRAFVFVTADRRPFSVASFTSHHNARLSRWFGPHVSNNTLRHARATDVYANRSLSLLERERIALAMGHSKGMHEMYAFVDDSATGSSGSGVMTTTIDGVTYRCYPVGGETQSSSST